MKALASYGTTLLVYALVDILGVLALNLQFGFAGIINFAFIVYVAVGAYAYALLTLGSPSGNGGFQHFFAGVQLPFPLPFILAGVAGCVAGALSGGLLLKRLRPDFQGLAFYALSFMAAGLTASLPSLVNGSAGLSLVPAPLASTVGLSSLSGGYAWFYVALAFLFVAVGFWVLHRLSSTPWGRLLRAVRDNEVACSALGKSPGVARYVAFTVGCGFAALSGALLVAFITAWAPASWTFPETVVFFTAIVIGGTANNWGASLGVVLVGVLISQAPLFLPNFAAPNTIAGLQWMLIGGLTMAFIWFRPQGLLPERIRSYNLAPDIEDSAIVADLGEALPPRTTSSGVALNSQPHPRGHSSRSGTSSLTSFDGRAPSGSPILRVEHVGKAFGGVHAVTDVSLSVAPGSITGLMGPNGAGKSTLLAVLAGGELPTDGRVFYDGQDVTGRRAAWLAQHGLVRTFQLSSEFRNLSVIENLLVGRRDNPGEEFRRALVGRRHWIGQEAVALHRAHQLLADFGLTKLGNDKAGALSGGQRRLVELMRALMTDPRLLLLDEPLAGLARATGDMFLDKLTQLREQRITIVLVEHELRALHQVADHVIVMARGCKLAEGTMAEMASSPEVLRAYVAG